jgi:DHA1 family inner membrane transport protein
MARLMDAAPHAQATGAAMSHSSLNIGNALGAWLGGLVISAGYGFRSPLIVGAALALAGLVVLVAAQRAARAERP